MHLPKFIISRKSSDTAGPFWKNLAVARSYNMQKKPHTNKTTYFAEIPCWGGCFERKLNIWPWSMTLTFDWPEQIFEMANLLMVANIHKCRSCALGKLNLSQFNIWLLRVTLTLDLPEEMIEMAYLLIMEKKCQLEFWNPSKNIWVMLWTRSIYTNFKIWHWSVTLKLNEQIFEMAHLLMV